MNDNDARHRPGPEYWCGEFRAGYDHSDLEASRDDWDKRSVNFVHKGRKEDYVEYFLKRLPLCEAESVFDMACGAGAVTIPLAKAGHPVIAVDFSQGMLDALLEYAAEEGVDALIQTHRRAWQDDLTDLPVADVAISSRSLILDDLADAIAKLESKARRLCVITLPGPDRKHMGEPRTSGYRIQTTAIVMNYLMSLGRLPKLDYIEYAHILHAGDPNDTRRRSTWCYIEWAPSKDRGRG